MAAELPCQEDKHNQHMLRIRNRESQELQEPQGQYQREARAVARGRRQLQYPGERIHHEIHSRSRCRRGFGQPRGRDHLDREIRNRPEDGAHVAAVGRTAATLNDSVEEADAPGRVRPFPADVADPVAVERCVEDVLDWAGGIDVLVNNAGVLDSYRPAHETSVAEWQQVIGVNLTGPFLMTRAVAPTMLAHGAGCIINVGSTS